MILSLIILYVVTLVYISTTERFRHHATLIAYQGWLLLAIALLRLHSIAIFDLLFVLIETLVFKAIVVPMILRRIIRHTKVYRVASSGRSQFNNLMLSLAALAASACLTYLIADPSIGQAFFCVALYALLSGLILIVTRRRLFAHLVGFLVIENGVFLFSMAMGVEMPALINTAILLDIVLSILMLGMFLQKIGDRIKDDTDSLTSVKD